MKEISVFTNRSYANSKDYLPLLNVLGEHLNKAYGGGFPKRFVYSNEPLDKMYTPRFPQYFRRFIVEPFCKLFKLPLYHGYIANVKMLDNLFAKQVRKDKSEIVIITPLLVKTIKKCKKAGKLLVVVAENSEPLRELERVSNDYKKYGIKKKYIYGDIKWQHRVREGFDLADRIICISEVSMKTYLDAGFDKKIIKLIPKNGTDLEAKYIDKSKLPKAFITTAFHSFIKGTQRLLLAWNKAKIDNVPLIVVGRLCDDMKEFVDKNGPFNNVVFEGHRSDLSSWYLGWDAIGVLLSLSEGGSKVIAEMMSFGYPMLVSPDATCDLVQNEKNGFIVDPLDEDALVSSLSSIANNWSKIDLMHENCYKTAGGKTMSDWVNEVAEYSVSLIGQK